MLYIEYQPKKNKVLLFRLLTMEEAEDLSTRLGIMVFIKKKIIQTSNQNIFF